MESAENYHYLNQSGCFKIDEVDDAAEFADVLSAMKTLQFSQETIRAVFAVIAGVLALGNVDFVEGSLSDSSAVSPQSEKYLSYCADLFGLNLDIFRYCLIGQSLRL